MQVIVMAPVVPASYRPIGQVSGTPRLMRPLQISLRERDAGQEFAEGGAVGRRRSCRGLGGEDEGGAVADGDPCLDQEAAPCRALHVQQPGGRAADRDGLVGLRGRWAWMC